MAISADFLTYVREQLSALKDLTSRRMFGGVGLYAEGVFFGLIANDVLYFKVGDGNRCDYEARGMSPFRPHPGKPHVSLSYYEVPSEVLEDRDECGLWARRSVAVASVTTKKARSLAPSPKRSTRQKKTS
jgi:DNA transformation protein